jgi:hypothetical protein
MSKAMNALYIARLRTPNKTEIHHVDFITWNIKNNKICVNAHNFEAIISYYT